MKMNQKSYHSTRSDSLTAAPAQAVLNGIAPDGGLYTLDDFRQSQADYREILALEPLPMAARILSLLLPDFSGEEMLRLVEAAYAGKFETADLTPTVCVG